MIQTEKCVTFLQVWILGGTKCFQLPFVPWIDSWSYVWPTFSVRLCLHPHGHANQLLLTLIQSSHYCKIASFSTFLNCFVLFCFSLLPRCMFQAWRDFIEMLESKYHKKAPYVAHNMASLEKEDVKFAPTGWVQLSCLDWIPESFHLCIY